MEQSLSLPQGLVVGNGLKTNAEWEAMAHLDRVAWLSSLDQAHVQAQASVRAAASRRPIRNILEAWRSLGYLSDEQATHAIAQATRQQP